MIKSNGDVEVHGAHGAKHLMIGSYQDRAFEMFEELNADKGVKFDYRSHVSGATSRINESLRGSIEF
jgi:hypothetical protein